MLKLVQDNLKRSEFYQASPGLIEGYVLIRANGIALLGCEVAAIVTNVASFSFEILSHSFSKLKNKHLKREATKKKPTKFFQQFRVIKHLAIGSVASAFFGWSIPAVNLYIHRRLNFLAVAHLNLETKKTTPLPDSYMNNLSGMGNLSSIDLTNRSLSKIAFQQLVTKASDFPKLNLIRLNKTFLCVTQIADLKKLVGKKAGLKVIDSAGEGFGSIYMDWHEYNIKKTDAYLKGMRETTSMVLKFFLEELKHEPNRILDFGAGTGQDAICLHRALPSSHIIAVDSDKEALSILRNHLSDTEASHFTFFAHPISSLILKEPVDLLISSFAWPYRSPEEFPACWKKCLESVSIGGCIAGHFFGPVSTKETDPGICYHSEDEIKSLLSKSKLRLIWFKTEPEGSCFSIIGGTGKPAWGALHHIVAQKMN